MSFVKSVPKSNVFVTTAQMNAVIRNINAALSTGGGLNIETIVVDMSNDLLIIPSTSPSEINYVFAGMDAYLYDRSSIIKLSDGSYLIGPKLESVAAPA